MTLPKSSAIEFYTGFDWKAIGKNRVLGKEFREYPELRQSFSVHRVESEDLINNRLRIVVVARVIYRTT